MQESLGTTIEMALGQEFLTWLWYNSEEKNGTYYTITEDSPYNINIVRRIVVRGGEGEAIETASVSGANSALREAKLGLNIGKLVISALIQIEKDALEWQFNFKADDFALNSYKTPPVSKEDRDNENPDALFFEKIGFIENGLTLLDDCYEQFLKLRLDKAKWKDEVENMSSWIKAN